MTFADFGTTQIFITAEEWKTNLMSLVILFHLLCAQHVLQPAKRTPPNIRRSKNSNTQRTENKTTDVVIHQQSRRLLKMDILMCETCWAHNKWNKIASDIKLVFHSSTITMMHGPINISFITAFTRSRHCNCWSAIHTYLPVSRNRFYVAWRLECLSS